MRRERRTRSEVVGVALCRYPLAAGVDSMIDSFTIEGPACQIASMLPLQSLVGTSGKVVFDYKRLNVGADGITTGGTMPFTYRNPAVKIKGPSPLVAQVGEPAEATYTLDITDMKPPYKVTWTANGVTETNSFTSRSITWDLGNAKPVSYLYKTISVKVRGRRRRPGERHADLQHQGRVGYGGPPHLPPEPEVAPVPAAVSDPALVWSTTAAARSDPRRRRVFAARRTGPDRTSGARDSYRVCRARSARTGHPRREDRDVSSRVLGMA